LDGVGPARFQLRRRGGECQGGEAFEQQWQGDLQLHPCEVLPQALVHAVAERVVLARAPVDVELVGFGEHLGIEVGRPVRDQHSFSGADALTGDVDVRGRHANAGGVGDGGVAQELLDDAGHHSRVGAELGELIGVFQQHHDAQGDHVGGGLVARGQQQHGGAGEVVPGQLTAGELTPCEPADQARPRALDRGVDQ
jgi:hypothetical protein